MSQSNDDFKRNWAIENFIEAVGDDIEYFATIDKTELKNALKLAKRRDELKRPVLCPPAAWKLLRDQTLGGRPHR